MCDARRVLRNLLAGAGRVIAISPQPLPRRTPEQQMRRAIERFARASERVRRDV